MERTRNACALSALQCPTTTAAVLMVWTGIMLDGFTHFHVVERSPVPAVRYRAIQIKYCMKITAVNHNAVGEGLINNNVRPHRAHSVDEFFKNDDICCMD
ncbi:hypothetical protein TNCV_2124571 [Trichonephila clavipes]|uniref:Uncharacterized protein n=1 Tax=Trichonephila clavipes TaxID=2585209 RepID=A0A8X6RAP3_TRICX|nr:hypothetical protein TNCV_2124571 [Trichonephila clavipes]